jgi:hypothetical protein
MADDQVLGEEGTVACDEIAGVKHQRVKLQYGEDGSATDVSTSTPLPTVDAAAVTALQTLDNLVLAEDDVHVSGAAGVLMLGVRKDAATSLAGADGDYTAPQFDSTGAMRVTGGTLGQYAEDTQHAGGDSGTMMLAVRRDANTSLVSTDGDYGPPQLTALGAVKVAITEDEIGSTLDTEDGAVAAGQSDVALVIGENYRYNGTGWVRWTEPAISERVVNTDGSSTAFTNFGATASIKNYVTAYTILRTDAGTTMAYVDFRDGVGGSVLWTAPLPAGGAANSPADMQFSTSANTALAYDVSSALTSVIISVNGFKRA